MAEEITTSEKFFPQPFLDEIGHQAANEATFSLHYGLFSNGLPQFLPENLTIPGQGVPWRYGIILK